MSENEKVTGFPSDNVGEAAPLEGPQEVFAVVEPIAVFDAAPRQQTKKRKRSTREILRERRYLC